MNFKRSTTSIAIAIMALSLISMASVQQDVFAANLGMSITATADQGSDTITLTGKTVSDITDVTFRVTSPSGNIVLIGQQSPDENGEFMLELLVGKLWTEDGLYEIQVMQAVVANSLYTLSVEVEVIGGMTVETSVTESNLEVEGLITIRTEVDRKVGLTIDAMAEIADKANTIR